MAFDILATQQPAAVDLRFILAVTKINADLERVGDQAVNIAERVMDLIELPAVEFLSIFRAWPRPSAPWCAARWSLSLKAKPNSRRRYWKWITSSIACATKPSSCWCAR